MAQICMCELLRLKIVISFVDILVVQGLLMYKAYIDKDCERGIAGTLLCRPTY